MDTRIFGVGNKKEERVLRARTQPIDFAKPKREREVLVRQMRAAMRSANGIGLSANQIGLSYRVFVAEVPDADGRIKQYAIFNPVIEKASKETSVMEEGCLSVPGFYGEVERPEKITLAGFDQYGKAIRIRAWGLLARVFQHEIDHLNGILFIDKAKNIHKVESRK